MDVTDGSEESSSASSEMQSEVMSTENKSQVVAEMSEKFFQEI
jgi:hypothetical protein